MAISIIIVNFCTRQLLHDCLASLRNEGSSDLETIVVDNHSNDGSAEMVRNEFPEVRPIENEENLGFAKANNQGIMLSRGEKLLLLNSDTVVRPGALQAMAEFLDSHPEAGGVTCRLLNADGSIQACVSAQPSPVLLFFRLAGVSRLFRGDRVRRVLRDHLASFLGATVRSYFAPYSSSDSAVEVGNVSGACLMLRRSAVQQVGPLDERFFMYFEDMDYCIRLRKAGWKLYYVPRGEIFHLVGQSSGGRMRNYSLHSYQSLFYFYRRHFSLWSVALVRLLVFVMSSLRWLWNLIPGIFLNSSASRRNRHDLQRVLRLCLE
jgi:hypothetical protein